MAIVKLKPYKAAGTDNIPSELIKVCGEVGVFKIHLLVKKIWKIEETPEEWKKSLLILVHKKGPTTDCNNYQGISLLPVCHKIFTLILTSRITEYTEEIIGDYQFGFRRNRSTIDQIFSLRRQMLQKKLE